MSRKIGFIGLGNMGLPMALNLCGKRFRVFVCSGNPESQRTVLEAGGEAAESLPAMAGICDVVITIVPADREILQLYSEDGILKNARQGLVCIDMTSAKGTTKQAIAANIGKMGKQVQFLEAPVSGGVSGAKAGTLTIMVGSTKEQFEENQDIFRAMGQKIIHTGPVGTASHVKMLNQMLNAGNTAVAAEVLCLSRRLGVDDEILYSVVKQSSGNSFVFEKNVPKYMMSGDHTPGFRLDLMKKDVGLFADSASECDCFAPVSNLVYQMYRAASNQGGGDKNYTYVYKWLEENQRAQEE